MILRKLILVILLEVYRPRVEIPEDARLWEAVRSCACKLHLLGLVDVGLVVHVRPQGRHLHSGWPEELNFKLLSISDVISTVQHGLKPTLPNTLRMRRNDSLKAILQNGIS